MLDTTTEAGARAESRLREEMIIWLTTVRSDGQPQSVPVWFLWDGEQVLALPESRMAAQLALAGRDPRGAFGHAIAELADLCEVRA